MASRKQDLLGLLIDTAIEQENDDLDNRNGTSLLVPADADISDDTEEDDAFAALRDDLSPGEAEEVVETMYPLSEAEADILDTTPGLDGLTRVDDAEQEDFVIAHSRRGYKGMDDVLDDAVYGEMTDLRPKDLRPKGLRPGGNEEEMERLGLDHLGWGIPGLSSIRKIGRMPFGLARRAAGTAFRTARMVPGAGTAFGVLRKVPGAGMVPGLDQGGPQGSPQAQSPDGDQPQDQDPGSYPDQQLPTYADQQGHQESDMNHNEEEMERLGLDSDSGFGLSSITHAIKRGAKGLEHGIEKGAGTVYKYSGAKYLVTKAEALALYPIHKVVRAFRNKMVNRKAQELAKQRGLAVPGPTERAAALSWAKDYTRHAHPTYGKLVASMMGGHQSDEMGLAPVVLYPLIVLGAASLAYILQKVYQSAFSRGSAAAQPVGPDGQPLAVGPDGMPMNPDGTPYQDPSMTPGGPYQDPSMSPGDPYQDPSISPGAPPQYADSYADPNAGPYASQGEDMSTGITGEDSLGAFATEILGSKTLRSKTLSGAASTSQTKADQLVNLGVIKLRSGKPLTPGEVGIIAQLAQHGHPRAKRVYDVLMKEGVAVSGTGKDESGAWLHMLNPTYWFKSSEEKKLTDVEKQKWIENAELQKQLAKKQETLDQAVRAKTAAEAVEAAKAQAAATEAQLKSIEASLAGELIRDLNADVHGALVGHEKPTAVTQVIRTALAKTGKTQVAQTLYAKLAAGQPLSPEEVKEARQIARLLSKIRVVHGDLYDEDQAAYALHGAFVGACVLGNIQSARARNARCQKAADVLSRRITSGEPLAPVEKKAAVALVADTRKLRDFTKSHVTGGAFVGLDHPSDPKVSRLRGASFVGAAKVMSPAEKKMLSAIVKLAKAGNPRAVRGLAKLKQTGEIMGGDHVGSFLSDTFNAVTMPITVPAKYLYKGVKAVGRGLGIISKGGPPSPEQVRLAKLRAARQRSLAAQARARAADAQTQAELRAQQAIADSADAEADAADAEALSKEAAMRTAEVEANPDMANPDDGDSSGGSRTQEFVGSWEAFVGYDPAVKDPWETPAQKKATARAAREKKIVAKAAEKSATGIKIRSGAALYAKAHGGDKKSQAAIRTMVARAKRGDQQAIADTRAVQAGRLAVLAREKAKKREAVALHRRARKLKVVAFQKKMEAAAANKLARAERRHQLKSLATVERRAAAGSPRHRAYVAKQVAAAKKGDSKARSRVRTMQLAKSVRTASPSRRERRNLIAAQKLADRARRGDPRAVRQVRVLQASARAGNPNAKRAVERLALGAAVAATIATGVVVLASDKKKKKMSREDHAKVVASAKSKKATGTASREELAAGARSAQAIGDRKTAGELAVAATSTPSATEQLKKTATVVAAKEAGNEEARKAIVDSLDTAKTGDPAAIQKTAKVVAVQTIDDLNKGQPISPAMRDAVNLNERAKAGDPTAVAEAQRIQEAATSPNPAPEATMAAVSLGAAVAMDKALAAKPRAKAELLERVNPPLPPAEQTAAEAEVHSLVAKANDGTITPEEGIRGVRLAEKINQPKLAAEIAAKAPPYTCDNPMSTLPDMPLAPIASKRGLFWESLKALTFTTPDPLANYRGGLAARGRTQVEPTSTSGWSPFAYFRSAAPWIAPLASTAAAAASFTNLLANKQHKSSPAAAAPAAPAASAAPAAPAAAVKTAAAQAPTTTEPDLSAISEGEVAVNEDDLNKMRTGLASFKAAKWRQPYPIIIDAASYRDDVVTNPTVTPEEKAIWGQLVKERVVAVSSTGRRMRINPKTRKEEIILSGETPRESTLGTDPDEVKARIRREIAEEGILPPAPSPTRKKRGKTYDPKSDESIALGADKSFRNYVKEAVKTKTMSQDDFNKAMEAHLGKNAPKEKKVASGEKVLKFLTGKGVKIA